MKSEPKNIKIILSRSYATHTVHLNNGNVYEKYVRTMLLLRRELEGIGIRNSQSSEKGKERNPLHNIV